MSFVSRRRARHLMLLGADVSVTPDAAAGADVLSGDVAERQRLINGIKADLAETLELQKAIATLDDPTQQGPEAQARAEAAAQAVLDAAQNLKASQAATAARGAEKEHLLAQLRGSRP